MSRGATIFLMEKISAGGALFIGICLLRRAVSGTIFIEDP